MKEMSEKINARMGAFPGLHFVRVEAENTDSLRLCVLSDLSFSEWEDYAARAGMFIFANFPEVERLLFGGGVMTRETVCRYLFRQ